MNRRFSISVPLSLAIALLCVAGVRAGAQTNSLTGLVRDSRGTPQTGAVVQLLRPDFSVVSEVFTDEHGRYRIDTILPGTYEVKAAGSLFLPTLRENLRVLGELEAGGQPDAEYAVRSVPLAAGKAASGR